MQTRIPSLAQLDCAEKPSLANYLLFLPEAFDEALNTELASAEPNHIARESEIEPTLPQMLAAFDPQRHGGEFIADAPRGVEDIA